jgi:hypothetical protein
LFANCKKQYMAQNNLLKHSIEKTWYALHPNINLTLGYMKRCEYINCTYMYICISWGY